MMDLREHYARTVRARGFQPDPAQHRAVEHLQSVCDSLCAMSVRRTGLSAVWRTWLGGAGEPIKGLYLWGDTGRGKTWLMDLFYDALPIEDKTRIHFHAFMRSVHERLAEMSGQRDPLRRLVQETARCCRVVCLDEFIVTNITDAMLLSGLLEELFREGVVLIATSNREPDELYKNGLQRERFLPAIEWLKRYTTVVHLEGEVDHRLSLLEADGMLYAPESVETDVLLHKRFQSLAPGRIQETVTLRVNHRPLAVKMLADDVAWFEFSQLCDGPRAAPDYIELARRFHTLILSGVPLLDAGKDAQARRFLYLVDALYDQRVKLVLAGAAAPAELYLGRQLRFPFRRAVSRLEEMRSHHYLGQAHRA